MCKVIFEISNTIIDFLRKNHSELPIQNELFQNFVYQAVNYLVSTKVAKSSELQCDYLFKSLLSLELASKELFQFTLDFDHHNVRGVVYDPTIQITSTSGNFHALIIKASDKKLQNYKTHKTIVTETGSLQIGLITNRLSTNIDLKNSYPDLYKFRQECISQNTPIIYILGPARQFPLQNTKHANAVHWQKESLDTIFYVSESRYGDNIVFGTGGWAGKIEGSLGIPRLGYLEATKRNKTILTTMPQCGAYDRHENSTLEVFCGQEWGDDSPVIAKVCDGAFVFGSFGTWTKIEIQNLFIQHKPFVIIDNPEVTDLKSGESARKVRTKHGDYYIFRDSYNAASFLFDLIEDNNIKFKIKHRRCNYA